ncbi:NmrA family NAD(P)-binding protein [Streptomyces sp. NPDC007905]|uniref:NmrA family NAD(P)-binding protein n=1 Tax=Streptomyces sp. NPDC007905 TaxID=3364788 RepID=UPI0036EEFDC6
MRKDFSARALTSRPWYSGQPGDRAGPSSAHCLSRGAAVRGLVRNPRSASARRLAAQDVEVVGGDLEDRESLATAMRGVAGVFAMTTPSESGPAAEISQGRSLLAAAHQARVPHLVFSSVAGADRDTGVPHFETKAVIERELAAGDVLYTILGPAYFFDNALGAEERLRQGMLDLPLPPDRPLQQLARPDLGGSPPLSSPHPTRSSVGASSSPATPPRPVTWPPC